MERTNTVAVIGATGLVGRFVMLEAARQGRGVLALLRRAEGRAAELSAFVRDRGGDPGLVRFVEADLTKPALGLDAAGLAALGASGGLVNAAALFAFGASYAAARRANVDGALEAVRLAAQIGAGAKLVHLDGYRYGFVPEKKRPRLGAYERTKLESVDAVRGEARRLGVPLAFVHPSSVIGHSRTGETTQLTGLGDMARAIHARALPVRVGSPRTFVPVVPVDHVARVVLAALDEARADGPPAEHYVLDTRTPRLFGLLDRIASHYGVPGPRGRLPAGLVRTLPTSLTKVDREALDFLAEDDAYPVASSEALAARHGFTLPDFDEYLPRWLDYLATNRFLEAAAPRPRGSWEHVPS